MTRTARRQLTENTRRNAGARRVYADALGRGPAPTAAALRAALAALKVA